MASQNFALKNLGFIRKNPAGMHWLGYNDAVSWLNEAKTHISAYRQF